jgi:hypothetical protein
MCVYVHMQACVLCVRGYYRCLHIIVMRECLQTRVLLASRVCMHEHACAHAVLCVFAFAYAALGKTGMPHGKNLQL